VFNNYTTIDTIFVCLHSFKLNAKSVGLKLKSLTLMCSVITAYLTALRMSDLRQDCCSLKPNFGFKFSSQ